MAHGRTAVTEEGAERHFREAKKHREARRWSEAAASLVAGLELRPTFVEGLINLAEVCFELGRAETGMEAFGSAARIAPSAPRVWTSMGSTLLRRGLHRQAAECYQTALAACPADSSIRAGFGEALLAGGRANEALSVHRTLTAWRPSDPQAFVNLGIAARAAGRHEEARAAFQRVLTLQPGSVPARVELAILLRLLRCYSEAEKLYRDALRLAPGYVPALHNLANLCGELLRLAEADALYAKVLAQDPSYVPSRCSRAMLWLLQGKFEEGWREYEWRWRQPGMTLPVTGKPRWDGSSLTGRTILLFSEQGAGDNIQFVRYARLLKDAGARVKLACRPELVQLMKSVPELDEVLTDGDPLGAFDVYCPMLDLPGVLHTGLASIPAWPKYLDAPPVEPDARVTNANGFKVGVVWAGNPNHPNDRNRSCDLALLAPILQIRGACIFSFQVGPASRDLRVLQPAGACSLAPVLSDYAATAANLDKMDAVLTVDTSVAHLAGALGRPTGVLLPASCDWRWLLGRDDSPWYPTMRLFRQHQPGEWAVAIRKAGEWLRQQVSARR